MRKKAIPIIASLVGVIILSSLVYARIIKHTPGPMNASMTDPTGW
jgi:hypothetical protein